ncbi:DUF2929 domain-containing protein [Virgibacillus phasianinus]|uniref:DUF2929 domain-containing protein n=1 Tax=Virgibacillus phasianinus TaxID=2017483 RepID=A0A220TYJ2_9BACI|nr:DUF2929 family protein [Virgibacillus phasianinus]ASK60810.1 DUF2929 domain-containing protein [Virgibacillus phasianinus]
MRFFWTFIWSLLLSSVLSYILTSMGGTEFNFVHTLVLGIILTAIVFILAEGVLKDGNKA